MTPPPRSEPLPRVALACTLAATLALTACATTAPAEPALPAVAVPADWSAGAGTPHAASPLAPWWQGFDDATLSAWITQALQANTELRSAQAALRQARALRDVQAAGLQPTLGGSASAQRSSSAASTHNQFQAGFDASWEPDVFGGARSAVDAAEANAQASGATLASVQVSVAAEVALNYLTLRGAQARRAIARDNLASQQETLQIVRWRNQAGLASSLDVEQARASTEQTRAQLPLLDTTIEQARNGLAVLTGQAPGALSDVSGTGPIPQPRGDLALAFPAETLRQRPDVRAAEWQVVAAAARVSQADAARLPSFRLGGSLGLSALTLGSLSGSGAVVGALLGSVSVPLLDGGAAQAQRRSQQAALESARVSYEAVVLAALQDVEDALVALRGHRERLTPLNAAAEAAGHAALLARQRYASGLVDFQTVLETQRTLLSAQDSVASTTADLGADHVRLYKALGGGWSAETPSLSTSRP